MLVYWKDIYSKHLKIKLYLHTSDTKNNGFI
jgi:hypothetical protein